MYLNRESIEAINKLKSLWGTDRFAQTNSRKNGSYLKHIRLYKTADGKRRKRYYTELKSLKSIRTMLKAIEDNGEATP